MAALEPCHYTQLPLCFQLMDLTVELSLDWASSEFGSVELGDKRLNHRLAKLAEALAGKPSQRECRE